MSIDPISTNLFPAPQLKSPIQPRPVSAVQSSDLGSDPEANASAATFPKASDSSSGEEVRLQRDSETGEPVYRFVDRRTGSLIVQIPSDQMLNLIHVIQQQLAQLSAKQSPSGPRVMVASGKES